MNAWAADARTARAWDGIMFFWVVFWLLVGAWTGYQIWQLTGLSTSTVQSGQALQSAGEVLQDMADAPVIGEQAGSVGDRVVSTAGGIIEGGIRAGSSIRGLSVLIGLAVGLAPTGPVLLLYLPARQAHRQEVAQIRKALDNGSGGETLRRHLAHRALSNLTYAQLRSLRTGPQADPADDHHALAEAELARLGLAHAGRRRP